MWRKSTRSGATGCVEVLLDPKVVGIRDSKDADSPEIYVDAAAWRAFVQHVTTTQR
ncbi:DUF397 domain-containing protein [Dactylosporangium aurantiacum]|nr:DUF397 domain-containing protein [Dactylosporangium aurantiacum]MDG6101136.1 DUF397 domain-containing protein [Dactylosporangium aurantiacum]